MGWVIAIFVVVTFWRFLLLTAAEVYQGAGMEATAATFQARSALTGAGYTTDESEMVVADPAGRDAASMLFVVGYVGPMAILGLLGLSFMAPVPDNPEVRVGVLLVGLAILVIIDRFGLSAQIMRLPARFVARHLFRAHIDSPWVVFGDQAVAGLNVVPDSPLVGRTLDRGSWSDHQVDLLGIQRLVDGDRTTTAPPPAGDHVQSGDTLIVFGSAHNVSTLRELAAAQPNASGSDSA